MESGLGIRACVVNLIESNNLTDMSKYLFAVFSVLNTMIMLEFPQINVYIMYKIVKLDNF